MTFTDQTNVLLNRGEPSIMDDVVEDLLGRLPRYTNVNAPDYCHELDEEQRRKWVIFLLDVLRSMSGQDFGLDVAAWRKWFNEHDWLDYADFDTSSFDT